MNLINLLIFREKYENNVKCQLETYSTENIISGGFPWEVGISLISYCSLFIFFLKKDFIVI